MISKDRLIGCALAAGLMSGAASAGAQDRLVYQYDDLGRLIRTDQAGENNSRTQIYQFDPADNRTSLSSAIDTTPHTINGDFESPAVSGFAYAPVAPGVQFGGQAGIAANGGAFGFAAPWNGNQVAFLQASNNQAGYFEIQAVGLVVGHHYQVAFAIAQRPGYPSNAVQIAIDGTPVWNGPPPSSTGFTPYPTPSFVATKPSVTIRFSATPTSYDSASAVDAVNVQQLD